jgi:phosphopantetheine--protein transferase-like protein
MNITSGVDIVDINRFTKIISTSGNAFKNNIFFSSEITNNNIEHLAVVFAGKEAVMKALSLKNNDWLKIEIVTEPNGKPVVILHDLTVKIISDSISFTHDGDKAIALYTALI